MSDILTKEQEAQQAQTIAEIKERHTGTQEGIELGTMRIGMPTAFAAHHDRKSLLEIVDHQAQKIAEQAKEIEIARRAAEGFRDYHYESSGDTGIYPEHRFPWETTDSKEVAR